MNKVIIAITAAAVAIVASVLLFNTFRHKESNTTAEQQWRDFKEKHQKFYGVEEENHRFTIFKQNLDRIKQIQASDPGAEYGVTSLADLSAEEFQANYLGLRPTSSFLADTEKNYFKPTVTDIPASFDWRDKGAVTPVKNQGSCGSCWAFSAVQNVEGQNYIHHNDLIVLSEQQLVDCDKVDQGCNGGLMEDAFTYFANNGGVAAESDYPYKGTDGKCSFTPSLAKVQVSGYRNISTNETEIAQSLVELGPLAIGVKADPWQFYLGGISNPFFCNGDLDHGVLLVGYGTGKRFFQTTDFWTVKNSWGSGWGEKGYIRLVRGKGVCGVNKDVTCATIA